MNKSVNIGMLTDTTPDAAAVQIDLFRQATPARRLESALRMSAATRKLARRGIARAHPDWSPRECDLMFVRVHYGADLAGRLATYWETHGTA